MAAKDEVEALQGCDQLRAVHGATIVHALRTNVLSNVPIFLNARLLVTGGRCCRCIDPLVDMPLVHVVLGFDSKVSAGGCNEG